MTYILPQRVQPLSKKLYEHNPIKYSMNTPQKKFVKNFRTENLFLGGRGSGKTHILGFIIGDAAVKMPQATGILLGPTFDVLKNTSLSAIKHALKQYGYIEYTKFNRKGNVVYCQKPPEHFKRPLNEVETYANVITFLNGHTIKLYSFMDLNMVRGNSIDYVLVDEAGGLDEYDFNSAVLTAMRNGHMSDLLYNPHDVPYFQSMSFFTSMPWNDDGEWLLNFEEKSKTEPDVNFVRCTSWENIDVIGEKILRLWEKKLLPTYYDIEVMCRMPEIMPSNFYISYKKERNVMSYIEPDPNIPLVLSFDFNNYFVCCTVAQFKDNSFDFIDEFYTQDGTKYSTVLEDFILKYKNHFDKHIILTGDRGKSNKIADMNSAKNDYDKIELYLRAYDWTVERRVAYKYDAHIWKYKIFNHYLSGNDGILVRFCESKCSWLIKSIPRCKTIGNYQKDKRNEGKSDPRLEPHLSDAADYALIAIKGDSFRLGLN